ncbi:tRNA (guanine(37)-N1)-methyltransferase [Tritrichomonas foetus]|uniref:tRNA (guanine(37)-N1)-methyltransferase n=1 Tax=Tritrichomonas foetus TaxID=1144522 RepID=A0A1J4KJN1_9EUKA|nr:tRNA (guanine(37)-N1)-methyltransferase [Tritrichomonas foetus]|eukprot:OHT11152.1 tRNA (guanine(37)-N1)-methyltransferase [Tritrichomonas foetus]
MFCELRPYYCRKSSHEFQNFFMIEDLSKYQVPKTFQSFVVPPEKTGEVIKLLRKCDKLANYPGFRNVREDPNGRRILLAEGVKDISEIPDEVKNIVGSIELSPFDTFLDYHNYTLQDLMKLFLPEGCVIPSSFETIGHIARLNLLPEQQDYKKLIGQAILLKNPVIKTVVSKIGTINNVYRSMELDVLAGDPNFETEVKQSGFHFKLDFSKVYWNSRLEGEHDALVSTFNENAIVADAMCGIGPFAVRAAKKKNCKVYANDLNPDSYKWLQVNAELNHVADKIICSNLDAREFIVKIFENGGCDYIIMNLPKIAVEFLDAVAEGAQKYKETARMPICIFHTFDGKDEDHEASILARAVKALGMPLARLNVHKVRDVSPGKDMFRCSFDVRDLFNDE